MMRASQRISLLVGMRAVLFVGLALSGLLVSASSVLAAETSAPRWTISAVSHPTNFKPGGDVGGDAYVAIITNTGDAASSGALTITDELPAGLEAVAGATAEDELDTSLGGIASANFSQGCEASADARTISCTYSPAVVPDDTLVLTFPVKVVAAAPTTVTNVVRVSGGGAPSAAMQTPTEISATPAKFGISPGGAASALSSPQAGAHADLTV